MVASVFGPPSGPAAAGIQAVVVALFVSVLGYLIVNVLVGRRDIDPIVRTGLVFPALLGASLLLMLAHIASSGRFFANQDLVRVVTLIGFVALAYSSFVGRRRFQGGVPRPAALVLVGVLSLALFIWGRAVFELLPAGRSGDSNLHAGWAASLLNGELVPSNALTGEIPNYYPWLFHGALAWVSALTPGGRPFHALGPLQLLQVGGAAATLFALGYTLWRKWAAGVSTALLGAVTGGFGFMAANARLIYRVRDPGSEVSETFGDLMGRRSFNLSFHNLVPVHPREVTYTLLPALILLFVLALRTGKRFYLIAAGGVLGLIGLTGAEAFIAGVVMTAGFVATAGGVGRMRAALHIGLPAAALYCLWFVPLMFSYAEYGGFFDLSDVPVALTPAQVLGGWGVVTPLAILGAGLLAARVRRDRDAVLMLVLLGVIGALVITVLVLGSNIEGGGFGTLGRAHRFWPVLFLTVALCGGFGFTRVLERAAHIHVAAAIVVFVLVASVALASPWIAAGDVKDATLDKRTSKNPTLGATLRGDQRSWLAVLSPAPGRQCNVAVPEDLMLDSYAHNGYRHVLYGWGAVGNTARVRWRNIYSHIPTDAERRAAIEILVLAEGSSEGFRDLVESYALDRVVVEETALDSPALAGYEVEEAFDYRDGERFGVVFTGRCSDP